MQDKNVFCFQVALRLLRGRDRTGTKTMEKKDD
jgi:hypothetical protein